MIDIIIAGGSLKFNATAPHKEIDGKDKYSYEDVDIL